MSQTQCAATQSGSRAASCCLWSFAVVCATACAASPSLAQSPLPLAASDHESAQFQARIDAAAQAVRDSPRLRHLTQQQAEAAVTFVAGNMLFVLLHEMGHAVVQEMKIPVLGREEDAADDFAILRLLKIGSTFSHRVLIEATKGWFLSNKRDQHDGEKLVFYDEHGLDQQRAYQIVCLMVGSDPKSMVDLASETELPQERRDSCEDDFANASRSWNTALTPHRRAVDEPKAKIEVVYGAGKGPLQPFERGFRIIKLLETVAAHAVEEWAWPAPFTLEMQNCGFVNARWIQSARKLTLCYELALDFAELYRDFNGASYFKRKRKSKSG
jgi:Putative metallopeptidase